MIVIVSLWRNDAERDLLRRMEHLYAKTAEHQDLRWLWVVGDSVDATEKLLRRYALRDRRISVIERSFEETGEDVVTRRRRSSWTATQAFAELHHDADFVCLHESDLITPLDVLDRLLASGEGRPIAGWPTLCPEVGGPVLFYDIWAYRGCDGRNFQSTFPYHESYRWRDPFQVGSFGSVWLAPAHLVRNRVMRDEGCVELCAQWQQEGISLLVDPMILVQQPAHLWSAS